MQFLPILGIYGSFASAANHTFRELPLDAAVFEAIHRFNSRFERVLHDFRHLQAVPYFPHHKRTAWQNILRRIQAETNFALSETIRERAETNALYFDRLYARRERELTDPNDVLLEAETRKQELTEQQKTTNQTFNICNQEGILPPRVPSFFS